MNTSTIWTDTAKEKNLPILKFFAFEHLPPKLQDISEPFGKLALQLATTIKPGAELAAGLRKLLEAKDCAVRAALDDPSPSKFEEAERAFKDGMATPEGRKAFEEAHAKITADLKEAGYTPK